MADKMQDEQNEVYFEFEADFKMLRVLRDSIANMLSKLGFSSTSLNDTLLIINEAFTNIVEYSYDFDRAKIIIIKVFVHDDKVEIVFRDFGKTNEFLLKLGQTASSNQNDIPLIEKLADGYFIKKVERGNELHLIKNKK